MQVHTKKRPADTGLVPLHFMVNPANVEQITRFVSTVEPSTEGDSVPWRESFMNHFPNSTIAAVCLQ